MEERVEKECRRNAEGMEGKFRVFLLTLCQKPQNGCVHVSIDVCLPVCVRACVWVYVCVRIRVLASMYMYVVTAIYALVSNSSPNHKDWVHKPDSSKNSGSRVTVCVNTPLSMCVSMRPYCLPIATWGGGYGRWVEGPHIAHGLRWSVSLRSSVPPFNCPCPFSIASSHRIHPRHHYHHSSPSLSVWSPHCSWWCASM